MIVHWAPRKYLRVLDSGYFYWLKTPVGLFLPFEYERREISQLTFVMFQDQRSLCWKFSSVKAMCSISSVWLSQIQWKRGVWPPSFENQHYRGCNQELALISPWTSFMKMALSVTLAVLLGSPEATDPANFLEIIPLKQCRETNSW